MSVFGNILEDGKLFALGWLNTRIHRLGNISNFVRINLVRRPNPNCVISSQLENLTGIKPFQMLLIIMMMTKLPPVDR